MQISKRGFFSSPRAPVSCCKSSKRVILSRSVAPGTHTANEEKLSTMRQRFEAFDLDRNGKIDREELRQVLESLEGGSSVLFAGSWIPEDELDRVMATYDRNKDGVIDYDEFESIVLDGLLLEGTYDDYDRAFRAADKSGNGTIGATELMEMLDELDTPVDYEKLVEIFQKYDKDESGQIDFGEFLLMFRDKLLDLKAMSDFMALGQGAADKKGSDSSQPLMIDGSAGMSIIMSEEELNEILSIKDGRITVIFAALSWCRPCKAVQRSIEKMAEHYSNSVSFVKLYGNANSATKRLFKERLMVRSTPCFMVFQDGELVGTQNGGPQSKHKIEDAVRRAIDPSKLPTERLYHDPL